MPNLPSELLQHLRDLGHFDEAGFVSAHAEENRLTSIRLNPFKKAGLDFTTDAPVPWHPEGFYLRERPSFTLDPLFQAGCYYPQEAGSMFTGYVLRQLTDISAPLRVLDACAAPGGKSTLINALISPDSLLVANELIKSRAEILVQNLSKWGTGNTIVTNNDPAKFSALPSFFDVVVADAPCSGSGLFRKQPGAIAEWSPEHVTACGIRQKKILAEILPALKPGGLLIYSTCSYSAEENEEVVRHLLSEFSLEYVSLPVPDEWGITDTGLGYRFYPHLTGSEGFFCAVLRKTQGDGQVSGTGRKKGLMEVTGTERDLIHSFVEPGYGPLIRKNNQIHLLSPEAAGFLNTFEKHFYFKKAGVTLGEIKGKDLVPNQELAWFTGLNAGIPTVDLSLPEALSYLRKENFQSPSDLKGLVLISYKNQGLGWAKILPGRINNYLPHPLRILK